MVMLRKSMCFIANCLDEFQALVVSAEFYRLILLHHINKFFFFCQTYNERWLFFELSKCFHRCGKLPFTTVYNYQVWVQFVPIPRFTKSSGNHLAHRHIIVVACCFDFVPPIPFFVRTSIDKTDFGCNCFSPLQVCNIKRFNKSQCIRSS